jgi:hypothetical protein
VWEDGYGSMLLVIMVAYRVKYWILTICMGIIQVPALPLCNLYGISQLYSNVCPS